MASNFNKAERYVKQGDEYKLLSYATSSESVEMTDGTDLQTAIDKKAPKASPTLTGTPKAPTASAGTNTTQIATTAFVQTAVANLVDSAPETLNTLGELATAIEEHQDVTDALDAAISNKVDKVDGKGLSTNDYTTDEKTKLSGIADGAEVNQNAFGKVTVGSTTISADAEVDTLTLVAGSNVTITPDATNDKVTITSSHPTITTSTDTTSTASPSAGGTFTTVDSVTRDSNGHVTKVNTKTVTLPSTSVTIDSALSSTSTNPVQNKVVNTALSNKLATTGDSKSNTVTFTSNDVADGSATSWTSVTALTSGITHATFFARVSQMFKNVRYLYKMLGTTDISAIGDGTVKGAISTLNSNLSYKMNDNKIIAGTNTVSFDNSNYVLNVPIEVGFKPNAVIIQSSDPVVTFGLATITDNGFTVNAYCITGVVSAVVKFSYQAMR